MLRCMYFVLNIVWLTEKPPRQMPWRLEIRSFHMTFPKKTLNSSICSYRGAIARYRKEYEDDSGLIHYVICYFILYVIHGVL